MSDKKNKDYYNNGNEIIEEFLSLEEAYEPEALDEPANLDEPMTSEGAAIWDEPVAESTSVQAEMPERTAATPRGAAMARGAAMVNGAAMANGYAPAPSVMRARQMSRTPGVGQPRRGNYAGYAEHADYAGQRMSGGAPAMTGNAMMNNISSNAAPVKQIPISERSDEEAPAVEENMASAEPVASDAKNKAGSCKCKTKGAGKLAAGLLGGLIGLLIGGIGVYAFLVLSKAPMNCPQTNCIEEPIETPATSEKEDSTFDFLKMETANQNLIYSPLSIRSGLALLSAGAAGETKAEIDEILGETAVPQYENVPDELSLANALFIRSQFQDYVFDSYISEVTTNNNADIVLDSFDNSIVMDDWASQKTFGLINSLGIIPTPDTQMVLANALAIQMDWAQPFESEGTYDDSFYLASGEEIAVPTMHDNFSSADITYYQDDEVTAITMPLASQSAAELEFVAVMPQDDLGAYVENLSMARLHEVLDGAISANVPTDGVEVVMPKFKFDYELKFREDLERLGMTTAFTSDADFTNLASVPLFVNGAVHKANIELSETGVKAAAVTAFATMNMMAYEEEPEPVQIIFDKPFFFVIRDRANDAVWFTGTVYNPAE